MRRPAFADEGNGGCVGIWPQEVFVSTASFQDWLKQGDSLYTTALKEFHDLGAKLDELEAALAAKQAEVNQIAQMIGKPPVEGHRRAVGAAPAATPADVLPAPIVHEPTPAVANPATPSSNASIARALTGRFGR